jgi:23S rRNA (adenine2503-C2)-methyltransferase
MTKISLCGMTADEIQRSAVSGYSHAVSVSHSIYKKKIDDIHLIPGIPKRIKDELNRKYFTGLYKPSASLQSSDGSIKYLFRNNEGLEFETVFLPDIKRNTVCVSSQSGCRIGCPYCATGRYGFRGNLAVQDILNQVLSLDVPVNITHIVFMGMGEPMDNVGNVLKACEIMSAEWGMSISSKNITVSTVGITDRIEHFLANSRANLALSLYSPFPEERAQMIPVEKKFPASRIIDIMATYSASRRMSIAYIMIRGINDTNQHLEGLKALVSKKGIRINLLPYHPLPGDYYISSPPEIIQHFKHELVISGISASIRKSRGADISAACGLLASGLAC